MGEFLAIGIVSKIGVKKQHVNKTKITVEQLQEKMRQELGFVPEIYELNEEEDFYYFQLKDAVLHSQLIPFLKTIYPLLYDNPVYYESVLTKLETLPPSQWLEWAKTKPEEAFQFDEYGTRDYLKEGFSDITIYYDSMLISMEGTIVMECYGRQFRFFKQAMVQAFQPFTLAGALRVYITG